jgi:hypothetical protein
LYVGTTLDYGFYSRGDTVAGSALIQPNVYQPMTGYPYGTISPGLTGTWQATNTSYSFSNCSGSFFPNLWVRIA